MTIADAQKKTKGNHGWQHLLLIVIVIIGGYFRFIGLNWDEIFTCIRMNVSCPWWNRPSHLSRVWLIISTRMLQA